MTARFKMEWAPEPNFVIRPVAGARIAVYDPGHIYLQDDDGYVIAEIYRKDKYMRPDGTPDEPKLLEWFAKRIEAFVKVRETAVERLRSELSWSERDLARFKSWKEKFERCK